MENNKKNLFKALADFQAELKPVGKDAKNPFFKSEYSSLSKIMTDVQPLLAKHGLFISQHPVTVEKEGEVGLLTILGHSSGECLESIQSMPVSKKDAQAVGSAQTYMRRYAISAVLGIVAELDDDANSASGKATSYTPNKKGSSFK